MAFWIFAECLFFVVVLFFSLFSKEMRLYVVSSVHFFHFELVNPLPISIKFSKGTEIFKVIKEIWCLSTGNKPLIIALLREWLSCEISSCIWTDLQVWHPGQKTVQLGVFSFVCLLGGNEGKLEGDFLQG